MFQLEVRVKKKTYLNDTLQLLREFSTDIPGFLQEYQFATAADKKLYF